MAKILKAEIYLVDCNDDGVTIDDVETSLNEEFDSIIVIKDSKESKEFEWDDELKINQQNSDWTDYELYFPKPTEPKVEFDKTELLRWLRSIYDCTSLESNLDLLEEIIVRVKNGVFDKESE